LALRIEEVAQDRPAGQRPEGQGPHELPGVLGQTDGDARPRPGELAQEDRRLVGGDRSRHAEDELAAVEHRLTPWWSRPLPSRGTRPWRRRSLPAPSWWASCAWSRRGPWRRG